MIRGATLLLVLGAAACSGDGGDEPEVEPGSVDGACPMDESVGSIVVSLQEGFTSVQGKFGTSVAPQTKREVVMSEGDCQLLKPVTLFCDPPCSGVTTCGVAGECIPAPTGISVGDISVSGLSNLVEMNSRAPVFFYTNVGTLAHPAFAEGDRVHLQATGQEAGEGFGLDVIGIAGLVVSQDMAALQDGVPIALSWTAPSDMAASEITIVLNIAQHGGTPGSIECHVSDNGNFTMPVALSSQLLAAGFSGFPSLSLARHSTDSAVIATANGQSGCVEFVAESKVTLPVVIDGLVSCSTVEDCSDGQICGPDLSCQDA